LEDIGAYHSLQPVSGGLARRFGHAVEEIGAQMNQKTRIYFGPPLAVLTEGQGNTLEISGKINRTAERYIALLRHHGVTLTEEEQSSLREICHIGYLSPQEIAELPDEVRREAVTLGEREREALAVKLGNASFADLVAMVETLGF